MIRTLMIVFLVILLLGGGFGALTTMKIIPDVLGIGPVLSRLMGQAPADDGTAAPQPPPPPDYGPEPEFLPVPQLVIPVMSNGVTHAQLMLSVRLHVDPEAIVEVKRLMPRLTDAYLTGLLKELPRIRERSGRLDLASVKAVLKVLTHQIVGRDAVHDVLISMAYAR